ncbi:hypothetical protein ACWF94_14640 [Streptomyces sp. NPDC055078]
MTRSITGYARHLAAGALAGALLLTGCGSDPGSAGGPDPDRKPAGSRSDEPTDSRSGEPAGSPAPGTGEQGGGGFGTGPGTAARLDPRRVTALLPGADSVPGWSLTAEPVAFDLTRQGAAGGPISCVKKTDPVCEGALLTGSSLYAKQGEGTIAFTVYAYQDAASATAAYAPLWERLRFQLRPPFADATLPSPAGEQHSIRRGKSALTPHGATVQARVGTTLVVVETGGLEAGERTGEELRAFVGMIAERSRQAQNGETPSAVLKG